MAFSSPRLLACGALAALLLAATVSPASASLSTYAAEALVSPDLKETTRDMEGEHRRRLLDALGQG